MVNVGRYNRRLTYELYTSDSSGDYGGYTPLYSAPVTTWCSAKQLSQKESVSYGLALGEASYQFNVRYEIGKNIDQQTKLTYEGVEYRVISVTEIDEYKREIVILANRRKE